MNLEPTDEQRALRDTVRQYLAGQASVAGHVRPLLDDPTGTTAEAWQRLAALGATAVLVPTECDGLGMTMVEASIVAEELGAGLDPGPWRSSCVAVPRAIVRFGAGSVAKDLQSALADGSLVATVGPLGPTSVQAADRDGGVRLDVRLDGRFDVADAAAADVILTIARDGDDVALYAVEPDGPGVSITPRPGIDRTAKSFEVVLTDASARLLGSADASAVTALVDDVLVISAAGALGAAQRLLDVVLEYARNRVQFGHPIGSFQSVAHLCVDMFETVELMRSGVMYASWTAGADDAAPGEQHLAALRLKGFATRLATLGDTAIQVLGGIGYTWDHDAHLYLKWLLSWSAFLGSPGPYYEAVGRDFAASVRDQRLATSNS